MPHYLNDMQRFGSSALTKYCIHFYLKSSRNFFKELTAEWNLWVERLIAPVFRKLNNHPSFMFSLYYCSGACAGVPMGVTPWWGLTQFFVWSKSVTQHLGVVPVIVAERNFNLPLSLIFCSLGAPTKSKSSLSHPHGNVSEGRRLSRLANRSSLKQLYACELNQIFTPQLTSADISVHGLKMRPHVMLF